MPYHRTENYDAASGDQPSWNLDYSIAPFQARVVVSPSNGATVDYAVEYTLNPLEGALDVDADAVWVLLSGANETGVFDETIAVPVARIRLVIAANDGVLNMTMLQGMSIN